jgi:putative ABC transport system permease protein
VTKSIERTQLPFAERLGVMATVGWAVMVHDRLKFIGTLFGVVFAVVLANQAMGVLLGLIAKNAMILRNVDADIWIVAPGSDTLAPGKVVPIAALNQARATKGVQRAEPFLLSGGNIALPNGGREPVTVIGVAPPYDLGGPWNMVIGNREVLRGPDAVTFDLADRKTLGGITLGGEREINGHRVVASGFTWGVMPFTSAFVFADYTLARELTRTPSDQTTCVLAKVRPGTNIETVKRRLAERLPETLVLGRSEYDALVTRTLLVQQPIGVVFGASTVFGLVIGFLIVTVSMFSAVNDHLREYGTLKAIGATNFDLGLVLFAQALAYALIGTLLGTTVMAGIVTAISSPTLTMLVPPWMILTSFVLMTAMCVGSSCLALLRLRSVEPSMVFR